MLFRYTSSNLLPISRYANMHKLSDGKTDNSGLDLFAIH